MQCRLCGSRKARRACPALGETICAVCCGTKRLTEIACPSDCGYLATAREHPAAVVRRQQERDIAVLLPTIQGLSERQHHIYFLFQTLIARHKPEGFSRLLDEDVAEAASAVAATLETASRGLIYEHAAQSPVAQRLAAEMKALLEHAEQQGQKVHKAEVAIVLRALEKGARAARTMTDGGDTAYLGLMRRLLRQQDGQEPEQASERPGSSLIIP